jgi:diaminopimelate epimerase
MAPVPTEFFKMSAGGNDFIVLDNRSGSFSNGEFSGVAMRLCTRAQSVGGDGVILLESSERADVRARFFNPDGQSTFCGNGARCAARMAYLQGMAPARMKVETDLMVHRAEVSGSNVSFEMRDPKDFEMDVDVQAGGENVRGIFVDTGVPHFVVFRSMPSDRPIDDLGRALRSHSRFAPDGANIDFVDAREGSGLHIRTFERGVEGETLACGTGCVAAALAVAATSGAIPPVGVRTRSGETISVRFEGDPRRASGVRLEGKARLVYVGQLTEESARGFRPLR